MFKVFTSRDDNDVCIDLEQVDSVAELYRGSLISMKSGQTWLVREDTADVMQNIKACRRGFGFF